MERNNERKRRNHRLQGSEWGKDKTITPPNSSKMGYDYGVWLFFFNHDLNLFCSFFIYYFCCSLSIIYCGLDLSFMSDDPFIVYKSLEVFLIKSGDLFNIEIFEKNQVYLLLILYVDTSISPNTFYSSMTLWSCVGQ